jgi:hypothetical protein
MASDRCTGRNIRPSAEALLLIVDSLEMGLLPHQVGKLTCIVDTAVMVSIELMLSEKLH